MLRVLLLLLLLAGIFFGLRQLYRKSPRRMWQWLAAAAGAGLILLALSGRAHWLAAVAGAALPALGKLALLLPRLLPFLPFAARLFAGRRARLRAAWLELTLDRRTGAVDGVVLRGALAGRRLSGLGEDELQALRRDCRGDPQSLALLAAYLQRARPGWRPPGGGAGDVDDFDEPAMSAATAARILGVRPGAPPAEVRAAHRALAQKLHPDRGGSDYLARKINQARDVLLRGR